MDESLFYSKSAIVMGRFCEILNKDFPEISEYHVFLKDWLLMNRIDSLEWHLHCMDDRLNNLQTSLSNYNSYMCNEIALSDRYWGIVSAVLAILAIILGIYITFG